MKCRERILRWRKPDTVEIMFIAAFAQDYTDIACGELSCKISIVEGRE